MEISIMSGSKLSDAQLVLLSSAAQHPQGEIKTELKGAAATKVVGKLLREQLVEEVPSGGTLPEWRRDVGLGSLVLCITKRGLAAIGVEASGAEQGAESARERVKADHPAPRQAIPRFKAAAAKKIERRDPASRRSKQARVSTKQLALRLPKHAWRTITWREGTNDTIGDVTSMVVEWALR
jgi:hypothetical protein